MKRIFLLFTLLLATHAAPLSAVEGGFNLVDEKWDAVLRLGIGNKSCSAGLIAPSLALTAAHCFDSYQKSEEIGVYSGANGTQLVGRATLDFVDPRYSEEKYGYDVAVITVQFTEGYSPPEPFTVADVESYHKMLAGVYPNRTILAAGHGLNENQRIGEKKAAFENQLSIFPWPGYEGMLFTDRKIGMTRPGDSGGPVFMATPSGIRIFGAVSGDNIYTYEDDGSRHSIIRNAPAIPSLCIAPDQIRDKLDIDAQLCAEVAIWEEDLYSGAEGALTRLWRLAHALESPLMEIEEIRSEVAHEVLDSFIQMDSALVRESLNSQFSSWRRRFGDRELRSHFKLALERRRISTFEDIWASDQATSDFIRLHQSADEDEIRKCGSDICHEWFRTRGGIRIESDSTVWDPVTSVSEGETLAVGSSEASVLKVLCSFISEGLGESGEFSRTTKVLEELGFRREFIGVSIVDTYSTVTASNSDYSFDLRFKLASRESDEVFLFAKIQTTLPELQIFSSSRALGDALSNLADHGFQRSASSNDEFKSYSKKSLGGGRASLTLKPRWLNLMVRHLKYTDLSKGGVFHDVFQCLE